MGARGAHRRTTRGFSLVEVIVALLLLSMAGLLLTQVVAPMMRTSSDQVSAAGAQLVALRERQFATRYGGYTGFPDDLAELEGVFVTDGTADGPDEVSIALGDQGSLGLAARLSEGCRFWLLEPAASGGELLDLGDLGEACHGASAIGAAGGPGEVEANGGTPVTQTNLALP